MIIIIMIILIIMVIKIIVIMIQSSSFKLNICFFLFISLTCSLSVNTLHDFEWYLKFWLHSMWARISTYIYIYSVVFIDAKRVTTRNVFVFALPLTRMHSHYWLGFTKEYTHTHTNKNLTFISYIKKWRPQVRKLLHVYIVMISFLLILVIREIIGQVSSYFEYTDMELGKRKQGAGN